MQILFISRNFPPSRGGMEKVAFNLHDCFSKANNIVLVKWSGSKKWLFLVLPCFVLRCAWVLLFKKIDVIYLGDGLLSVLLPFLKIFKKPTVITIHGLDVTYNNGFYQTIIPKVIRLADKVTCVSQATAAECITRGILKETITVIPNGINDELFINKDKRELKKIIENQFNVRIGNKKVLLSVGRLIERKGVHWFVEEVVPLIIKQYRDFVYIIVGNGPMEDKIRGIIKNNNLQEYVYFLKGVEDDNLKNLYSGSDIFVMPNIKVPGDFEGFGIVILEAASCGVITVASNVDGVRDAVSDGNTGFLLKPLDALMFCDKIVNLLTNRTVSFDPGTIRRITLNHFLWPKIAEKYLDIFKNAIGNKGFL